MTDHRIYTHNGSSCVELKPEKKYNPTHDLCDTSSVLHQLSYIKPTGSWSLCEFYRRWRGIQVGVRKNIFEVQEGLEDLHSRLLVASGYLQIIWATLQGVSNGPIQFESARKI